jgi:uncharacterized Fe-S cluster-containing radical SAM superfamily protein
MIDFLELLNKVARVARPAHHEFVPITDMNEKFTESCLDSLDMLMVGMYMSEIYDIDDAIAKELRPETPAQMLEEILKYKKQDPESIEAALEIIK